VQEFCGEKLNRRSLAVIVARISMAAATTNIFSWQRLAQEIISVLRFFLRHGGIRAQQRIFLNVLRESAAKFA